MKAITVAADAGVPRCAWHSVKKSDLKLTRYKFWVVVALAIFAMSACASEVQEAPSPWIDAPDGPTPTPVVSTTNGVTRIVVYLSPDKGEGQIGSATLMSDGSTTTVDIDVGPTTGEAQPIHIHVGKCDDVGSVVHALQNVVNGVSTTVLDRSLDEILAGDMLINVHASYADASNYTACGQLPSELP